MTRTAGVFTRSVQPPDPIGGPARHHRTPHAVGRLGDGEPNGPVATYPAHFRLRGGLSSANRSRTFVPARGY